MGENENLKREMEKLKKDLKDYLDLYSYLGVSEKERNRVINQFLDDILDRQKRLNNSN